MTLHLSAQCPLLQSMINTVYEFALGDTKSTRPNHILVLCESGVSREKNRTHRHWSLGNLKINEEDDHEAIRPFRHSQIRLHMNNAQNKSKSLTWSECFLHCQCGGCSIWMPPCTQTPSWNYTGLHCTHPPIRIGSGAMDAWECASRDSQLDAHQLLWIAC